MTKDIVLQSLTGFPEKFEVEDLIEHLIFLQQVDEGLEQSDRNDVVTLAEAKIALEKWLQ